MGHIQEPWYLFSKTTWASTWVSVWTSCAFWRCFDQEKWAFFSVLVSSSRCFFFFWRKIHEKSFPWTFAWLRDRCVKNWVIFEEFTNFTWHISDVCLGKFCDSLIWRQTHIYISLVKWLTSPKEPHQKNLTKRTSANDEMVSVFGSCTLLFLMQAGESFVISQLMILQK